MWKMSEMHISIKRNYLKKFQIIFPIFEKIKRRQVQSKFLKNHEKIKNNFHKIVQNVENVGTSQFNKTQFLKEFKRIFPIF